MSGKIMGKQTSKFGNPPSIAAAAAIVGPKEGEGPLGRFFDYVTDDEYWGEKSWERAESKLIRETFSKLLTKGGKTPDQINCIIAGDLLDQCIATSYGLRESGLALYGIYGACSTFGEALVLGAMLIDGGFAENVVGITSSHFCSAEKQFRYPLELGTQRPPTAQWTVTGSGGVIISQSGSGPFIKHVTTGKIVDMGIKDANNMGAAMAPAAVDTIKRHFKDTGLPLDYYDMILTGDLGFVGKKICEELLLNDGYDIGERYNDCGLLIYDSKKQDSHAGGSGCGCSATVFAGYIYQEMMKGSLKKVLLVPTGALLSPLSSQQGESIPSIAHAVGIEM